MESSAHVSGHLRVTHPYATTTAIHRRTERKPTTASVGISDEDTNGCKGSDGLILRTGRRLRYRAIERVTASRRMSVARLVLGLATMNSRKIPRWGFACARDDTALGRSHFNIGRSVHHVASPGSRSGRSGESVRVFRLRWLSNQSSASSAVNRRSPTRSAD
jgi:hypothetical protein